MARPTTYTKELLKRAKFYADSYEEAGDLVPSVAGLAIYLNISRETVYAWSKDPEKSEFSDIVSRLMAKQEIKLLHGGLDGSFNPTISKLMLSKHGYSEKQDIDLSSKDGSMSPVGSKLDDFYKDVSTKSES